MLLRVLRVSWVAVTVVSLLVGVVAGWPVTNLQQLPVPLVFAAVGLVLSVRLPSNPVGWFFGGGALVASLLYAAQNMATAPVGPSVAAWSAWLGTWPIPLTFIFLALPIVYFPDGCLPSPRWHALIVVVVAVAVLDGLVAALGDALFTRNYPHLHDPVQLVSRPLATAVNGVLEPVQLFGFLVAATAVGVRFRRSRGAEREQLKWFLFAVTVVAVSFAILANAPLGIEPVVAYELFVPLIPCAVAVAILRYRLYDIDRLVSRTVSWLLVSGLLAGVYLAMVILATRALPVSSSYGVAASTLAAAALFQPIRRRVQAAVDRRFNRTRYDAERTIDEFSRRLRGEVDLEAVRTDLLAVIGTTMQPAAAGLWLRDAPEVR